jgi:sortase A
LPDGAAGWDAASAYPGHGSNVVIAGHHNIAGEVFRDLIKLKRGDEVILDADGQIYRYRVSEILILPERDVPEQQRLQNATWMQPTRHERLTLITCWPYESNTHRLVVVALPEGSEPVKMAQVNQNP